MQAAPLPLDELRRVGPARAVAIHDRFDDVLPFDRILCPDLRIIGRHWLDLPRSDHDPLPNWHAFAPSALKPQIPKLCVLKVGDWRADEIEFALYGGHPTEYLGEGRSLKMVELRDNPQQCLNYYEIRDRAGRAIDNRAPQYVRRSLSWDNRGYIEYEVLMLPFQTANGVTRVLQPISAWTARTRPVTH